LLLTAPERLDEPAGLIQLRNEVAARLPRVDLPEILPEIAARTDFTAKFTHISGHASRAADLPVSLCAVHARDSLVLLAVVLEQPTELNPTEIMTDTVAYTDVIFGLFWLLGYRFSPRIADIGSARYWRIDSSADYGPLNDIARHRINTKLIAEHWDDLLRLAGSLNLGLVQATKARIATNWPGQLLIAEACNIGMEPLTRNDVPASRGTFRGTDSLGRSRSK